MSRSLGLSQGAADKPAGGAAGFGFQKADSGAGAREGQLGGMGGGADRSKQPAMNGRGFARAGGSAAPVAPPAPRAVVVTAPAKSVEQEKKPAPAEEREALVALHTRSRLDESRDRRPQLKNIKGAVQGAAIDSKKVAAAGAMPSCVPRG